MQNLCHNHRDFNKNSFIYENKAPAPESIKSGTNNIEKKSQSFLKSVDIKRMSKMNKQERFDFIKKEFGDKHHPDKFEQDLRNKFGKEVDENKINTAVSNYKREWNIVLTKIYREIEARTLKLSEKIEQLKKAEINERRKARIDVDQMRKAKDATPTFDKVASPAPKRMIPIFRDLDIPIISPLIDSKEYMQYKKFQRETTTKFTNYTNYLNKQYLESAQHAGNINEKYKPEYEKLSGEFKDNIKSFTNNQLALIYKTSPDQKTLKDALNSLSSTISEMYRDNDSIKQDGVLDLIELRTLKKKANSYINLATILKSATDEETAFKELEAKNLLSKESWIKSTDAFVRDMLIDVKRDGTETSFIKGVKKITGTKGEMDFDTAQAKFRTHMQKMAKTGVKNTISAAVEISKEVNGERDEILKLNDVNPPSIKNLVLFQRQMILNGSLSPNGIDDKHVAEFMRTNLSGRLRLLRNPDYRNELFQSIQNIKQHYPRLYRKNFRNIPRKRSDIETRSLHPNMPTREDRAARLLALLTLAKESEWVIKNLEKTHLKGQKLSERLENTDAERVPPKMDMKLRSVPKIRRMGHLSMADRGGLNVKGVGIGLLQLWAVATMAINVMNARKDHGGLFKGAAAMLRNPYFLAAGGTIYGLHKYKQNPNLSNYLKMSAGEQERALVISNLNGLSGTKFSKTERIGKSRLKGFVSNPYEFKAIKSMFKEPKSGVNKVRNLIRNADTQVRLKKRETAVITKEDLKKAGVSENAVNMLAPKGNERMRYLFYSRFLKNQDLNARQFEKDCLSWVRS